MEYGCAGKPAVPTGSVLVPITTNGMAQQATLTYKASDGKQEPERLKDNKRTCWSTPSENRSG
jgi:hypothetical protein